MALMNLNLRGSLWLATHSASIRAVLADRDSIPSVQSKGQSFYNADSWTLRIFTMELCIWASLNPGCCPTYQDIASWCRTANYQIGSITSEIVIAATPNELNRSLARALVGGAYHEAWHTRYSMRGYLSASKMASMVLPLWYEVKDWSKYHSLIQTWSNIIEDIRIERLGCKEFQATRPAMVELQDFVLNLENQGQAGGKQHGSGGTPKRNALSVVSGTFRDIGLGYADASILQSEALVKYEKDQPEAYRFVTEGPLAPLLEESINLSSEICMAVSE